MRMMAAVTASHAHEPPPVCVYIRHEFICKQMYFLMSSLDTNVYLAPKYHIKKERTKKHMLMQKDRQLHVLTQDLLTRWCRVC